MSHDREIFANQMNYSHILLENQRKREGEKEEKSNKAPT